jgi:uncharacterized protein YlaI
MEYKINDFVQVTAPDVGLVRRGIIVFMLEKGKTYDEETVIKYYGKNYPKQAFMCKEINRLVVEYEDNRYFIAPEVNSGYCNIELLKRGNK